MAFPFDAGRGSSRSNIPDEKPAPTETRIGAGTGDESASHLREVAHEVAHKEKSRFPFWRGAAVLAGALLLTWPALFNRYPLLYPDSITYLADGRPVARALFLHKFSDYYGMRSFIYSLGILLWHWNVTPWPIVAFQALLTAYVIWLVVRSIRSRRTISSYLVLVFLLSLLTSLGWFVSLIMPDILGPVLYLCIYLIVFARETLSRVERVAIFVIAWWAVASHATHLMVAAGLWVLLAAQLIFLRRQSMHRRMKAVVEVGMIVLLAAAAQLALHGYLYGEPTLNGDRPPFLMARIIADGPGRWYLERHCGEVKFVLCDHLNNLPDNADEFLWGADGVWQNADEATEKRIRQEEIPFVLATLRTYPREQLFKSASNFFRQLKVFGLELFDRNDWMLGEFDGVFPGQRQRYMQSRQDRNALDPALEFFTSVQNWTVIMSLVVIGVFIPRMWCRRSYRLIGLSVVIFSTIIANAFVMGTLSMVEDRHQSRVIWLVPLLAGVLVLDWCENWKSQSPQESAKSVS
jgi:hypothetical protein